MEFFISNIVYVFVFFLIVSFVFFFFKNYQYHNPFKKVVISNNQSEIRLRAYERLTLFLARIHPVGMINRLGLHDFKIDLLKSTLIQNIILEYEYNISQQIYVSDELWILINKVKDIMINQIDSVAEQLGPNSSSKDFVKQILKSDQKNKALIRKVQLLLNKEVKTIS